MCTVKIANILKPKFWYTQVQAPEPFSPCLLVLASWLFPLKTSGFSPLLVPALCSKQRISRPIWLCLELDLPISFGHVFCYFHIISLYINTFFSCWIWSVYINQWQPTDHNKKFRSYQSRDYREVKQLQLNIGKAVTKRSSEIYWDTFVFVF